MAYEPTPEDMAAAREQGDLVEMLLGAAGRTRKRVATPEQPDDEPSARIPTSPLHRPGTWPAGTRPTDHNTCHPNCDCALTRRPPGEDDR